MSRIKHTPEEKIIITKAVLSGESSQAELARQYNTSEGRIREWVVKYKANGISAFLPQRRNNVYSDEIRIKAVKDYLNGQGSLVEISSKYGIRDTRQLRNWIKVYNSGKGFRQKMSEGSRMKEARPTTVEERIQIARDCMRGLDFCAIFRHPFVTNDKEERKWQTVFTLILMIVT